MAARNERLTPPTVFCPGLKKGMVLLEEKGHFCSRNYILRALSRGELFYEDTLHKLWATHPMFERCHSVGPHSFKPRSLEPYPLSRIPLGRIPVGRIPLGRIPISRCPLSRIPFSRTSHISPSAFIKRFDVLFILITFIFMCTYYIG